MQVIKTEYGGTKIHPNLRMNITKWSKSCGNPNYLKKKKIKFDIDRLLYQFSTKRKKKGKKWDT